MVIAFSVALPALVGLLVATYFTAVAYRWMAPDAAWVPAVCRLDEGTCASIVFSPQARVLGIPNSVLGQAWYALLLLGAATGSLGTEPWHTGFVVVAAGTVVLGFYLAWSLLFVLRVNCRLCFLSHAINLWLLAVLLAGT